MRKFYWLRAKKLQPSSILPNREHSPELSHSVKRNGVQQPVIVRPIPGSDRMYEIVDGHGRVEPLDEEAQVLVDVRYDLKDADVFKISESTFKRSARTTYERALFYERWVDAVARETSSERGAQKTVAEEANLSEAEVSHYLSISRLFERLRAQNIPEMDFNALKNQAVNKLYALARVKDESVMLDVSTKMAETPDMTLEEVKALIKEQTLLEEFERMLLKDDDEEESEENRIDQLTTVAQELEVALDKTREMLKAFTSKIVGNPRRFLSPEVLKRIRRMLNALQKIEKEVNQIIGKKHRSGSRSKD